MLNEPPRSVLSTQGNYGNLTPYPLSTSAFKIIAEDTAYERICGVDGVYKNSKDVCGHPGTKREGLVSLGKPCQFTNTEINKKLFIFFVFFFLFFTL